MRSVTQKVSDFRTINAKNDDLEADQNQEAGYSARIGRQFQRLNVNKINENQQFARQAQESALSPSRDQISELNQNFEIYDSIQANTFENMLQDEKTDREASQRPSQRPPHDNQRKKRKKKKQKEEQLFFDEHSCFGTTDLNQNEIMRIKLYQDQIKHPELPMDRQLRFTHDDLNVGYYDAPRSAEYNKKLFIENFSIDIQIPFFFIMDSIIWNSQPQYILQLVKYVFPSQGNKTIQHFYDGKANVSTYKHQYSDQLEGNIILRLLQRDDQRIQQIEDILLKQVEWAKFKGSFDGSLLVILTPEIDALNQVHHDLKIYRSQKCDLIEILEKVKSRNYDARFVETAKNQIDLSFTQKMAFDNKNSKLIGWGQTQFFVLKIANQKIRIYDIQTDIFEQIICMNYTTNYDQKDQCMMICLCKSMHKLIVYDFFNKSANLSVFNDKSINQSIETHRSEKLLNQQLEEQYNKDGEIQHDFQPPYADEQNENNQPKKPLQKKNKFPVEVNLLEKPSENMKLEWSVDNTCLVYLDLNEKFVVEVFEDGTSKKTSLMVMHNKIVHYVYDDPFDKGFYILCSHLYDDKIELEHSHRDEIFIDFPRQIEPGIIQLQDMKIEQQQDPNDPNVKTVTMSFVGLKDDEFTYDRCSFIEKKIKQRQTSIEFISKFGQNQFERENFDQILLNHEHKLFTQITSFSIDYPYVSFLGMENYLVIINLNEPDYIHRIELSERKQDITMMMTQITDTYDLFAILNIDQTYHLFMIDLNSQDLSKYNKLIEDPYSIYFQGLRQPLMSYHENEVKNKALIKMHCRGSSNRQSIDFDEKLIVLVLHESDLYIWVQLKHTGSYTCKEDDKRAYKLKLIQTIASRNLRVQNDNCIYFKTQKNEMISNKQVASTEQIKRLDLSYSSFDITTVYIDSNVNDDIRAFNIDNIRQKIIILCESKSQIANFKRYSFKIFDMNQMTLQAEMELKNEQIIGRLLSGLYTFIDGHIYFNNNVVKIRYDLIKPGCGVFTTEDLLFDHYMNIFPLSSTMRVRSNTPLNCYSSRRFAYIIHDLTLSKPKLIKVLPYLHARTLKLHEVKKNTNYFYTSVQTSQAAQTLYNQHLHRKYQEEDPSFQLQKCGYKKEQDSIEDFDQKRTGNFSSIISINTSQSVMDVFLQNGQQIKTISFEKVTTKYGEPFQTSPDGTVFLFKHSKSNFKDAFATSNQKIRYKSTNSKIQIKEYMTVTVMKLTIFGFTHIKDISIMNELKQCLRQQRDPSQPDIVDFKSKNRWLFIDDLKKFIETVDLQFRVNNNMDICAQIKQLSQRDNQIDRKIDYEEELHVVYYLELCGHNLEESKLQTLKDQEPFNSRLHSQLELAYQYANEIDQINGNQKNTTNRVIYSEVQQCKDFKINTIYLFLIERDQINYFNFYRDFTMKNYKKIDLQIDKQKKETKVSELRCSNNNNLIAIVLKLKEGSLIIEWNIKMDCEQLSYFIDGPFTLLWDELGELYILNEDGVFMTEQMCQIAAFQFEDVKKISNNCTACRREGLRIDFGIKVDSVHHNWVIIEGVLTIPFSYMTFVIKQFEESTDFESMSSHVFDCEAHNYLLNRSNTFLDSSFVKCNAAYLQYVLQNLLLHGKIHLHQLNYSQKIENQQQSEDMRKTAVILQLQDIYQQREQSNKLIDKLKRAFNDFKSKSSINKIEDESGKVVTNSALHMAMKEGNTRSIDLILYYLSKIGINCSHTYRDIFHMLNGSQNYKMYMDSLAFTTPQMKKKQILKLDSALSDEIIQMTSSNTVHVDDLFFKDKMKENVKDTDCSSFPVRIVALKIGWMLNSEDNYNGYQFLQQILLSEDLAQYNIQSIRMIIEFLYQNIKTTILVMLLPCYICNQILFVTVALVNEKIRTYIIIDKDENLVQGTKDMEHWNDVLMLCLVINLAFVLIQAQLNFYMFSKTGSDYLKRMWTWVDLTILVISACIVGYFFGFSSYISQTGKYESNYQYYLDTTTALRIMLMIGQIMLFSKSQYFLSMIDEIAPLISIAQQITVDILPFLAILLIFMFSFGFAFFILAQNQLNFDDLSYEERSEIPYGTFIGSLTYIGNFIIGQTDQGSFDMGNGFMGWLLYLVFWTTCFVIMIVLLNMLIAIMGNTFIVGNESLEQQKYREHLRFVVDNWFLRKLAFKNLDHVKYVVIAFTQNDDTIIDNQFIEIKTTFHKETDGIYQQLLNQENKVLDIQRMLMKLIDLGKGNQDQGKFQ